VEGRATEGGKRLLVLGAGPGQLGLLEAARLRGLHVIAVDRNPAAPGFRFADRRAIVSLEDEPSIDRLAAAERVDGVIAPGTDFPVAIAARVAERLALPHPLDPASAQLAVSKLRQRERFAEAGVSHARYETCSTVREAEAAAQRLGYPCVVKAPDRQGQKGLALPVGPEELEDAFALAFEEARSNMVLVEEHLAGRELTVNAFSVDGHFQPLTVTDRAVAEPPAFGVALAHVWPSEASPDEVGSAVRVAAAAAEALGIRDGPTYTQVLIRHDPVPGSVPGSVPGTGGAVVGELAARLGGGHDAELCEAALGVDLNGLALSAALGEPIEKEALLPGNGTGGACIRFLVAPPGALLEVEGLGEAEEREGVIWVRIYREPGFTFGPLRHGSDRAGAVLAVGDSRGHALERAAGAADRIRFATVAPEALASLGGSPSRPAEPASGAA
jgi:biotin carboxylase